MSERQAALERKEYAASIRQIPSPFDRAVRNAPDDLLRRRPSPEEWSAVEILGHMVDKMTIWRVRLATILWKDDPAILGYDQDELVRANNYQESKTLSLVKALAKACELFAAVVESTTPALLSRKGRHSELGPISGTQCIEIPLQAAQDHLAQLRRALDVAPPTHGRAPEVSPFT